MRNSLLTAKAINALSWRGGRVVLHSRWVWKALRNMNPHVGRPICCLRTAATAPRVRLRVYPATSQPSFSHGEAAHQFLPAQPCLMHCSATQGLSPHLPHCILFSVHSYCCAQCAMHRCLQCSVHSPSPRHLSRSLSGLIALFHRCHFLHYRCVLAAAKSPPRVASAACSPISTVRPKKCSLQSYPLHAYHRSISHPRGSVSDGLQAR